MFTQPTFLKLRFVESGILKMVEREIIQPFLGRSIGDYVTLYLVSVDSNHVNEEMK